VSACELMERPAAIARASAVKWGVIVDAYLTDAARVGDRYAALVYHDLSGVIPDGMTIVTPPIRPVVERDGYLLVRSLDEGDHYVIVSTLSDSHGRSATPR